MNADEVEFLAEKQLITIIPNFSENKIYMIEVSDSSITFRFEVEIVSRANSARLTHPCQRKCPFGLQFI